MNINYLYSIKINPKGRVPAKKCGLSSLSAMLILLISNAHAQHTIQLSTAINDGLANNKKITAGAIDLTILQLQTEALYRKYWPEVSAGYTYTYNPILQTSILPIGIFNSSYPIDATINAQFGTRWSQTAGITVTQPLMNFGIKQTIREASLQERIATLSQEQTEYNLAFTIAQTYIDIYLGEAKLQSLIADTVRTYISYRLLNDQFEEDRLLKPALNTSKVNHNNTLQSLSDGVAQLIDTKVYLLYLMGANDSEQWNFDVDTTFSIEQSITGMLAPVDFDQSPDLQQLTLQSQLSMLQENSEKRKHLPTINLKGYLGANHYSNVFNPVAANSWYGLSYVGLEVKVPLLFGENSTNTLQQLQLRSAQFSLQKEAKTQQYANEAFTAKLNIDNLRSQLKTQEENISLSEESIAIFQSRVLEGQESGTNLNLEEIKLQLLKSEFETNKKQVWIYWLNYLNATGQLGILWKTK